jgi:hypothetical protein
LPGVWIFTKPLEELTTADLQGLVTNGLQENVALEFKRQMYGGADDDIREMLRDVASMANAEGGAIVIGMDEDGEGRAAGLVPVSDAETQAGRLVSSCLSNVAERIPGLRARPIGDTAQQAVVVRIPRSYRRPHMITFRGGGTDFWVRHDRQKSRMSIAEIRTALGATEELELKAERFIAERRHQLTPGRESRFVLMGTPLLLEGGRVDITDRRLHELLQTPPCARPRGVDLAGQYAVVRPSMRGLRSQVEATSTLEVFRNGHVEFVLLDESYLIERKASARIRAWAAAEFVRNFVSFVEALKQLTGMADPYAFTVSVWHCGGVEMPERLVERFGAGRVNRFDEAAHILLDPIVAGVDETQDLVAQRIADRFWNAFQFMRCPFFNAEGQFAIPND